MNYYLTYTQRIYHEYQRETLELNISRNRQCYFDILTVTWEALTCTVVDNSLLKCAVPHKVRDAIPYGFRCDGMRRS